MLELQYSNDFIIDNLAEVHKYNNQIYLKTIF
jgi:hypothetical protein